MTLIIGILCSDGVVLGADSAATYATLGTPTIIQPTGKISIIQGKIILGVSGPVGLGQSIESEIASLMSNNAFVGKSAHEVKRIIRTTIWDKCMDKEYRIAESARRLIGDVALQSVLSHTVLAMPVSSTPCLIQFDQQGAPELASANLPFVSCGCGQNIADPFLAFLRRMYWPETQPSVVNGIFAVLWTLHHAILTNPGGVAGPPQIAILSMEGREWRAKKLDEHDLAEHLQFVERAEDYVSRFPRTIADLDAVGIPSPPESRPAQSHTP